MSVRIHSELLARIHAHAAEGYPHEVVGLLAGDPVTGLVQAVHPLINERADSPRNRYRHWSRTLSRSRRSRATKATTSKQNGACREPISKHL